MLFEGSDALERRCDSVADLHQLARLVGVAHRPFDGRQGVRVELHRLAHEGRTSVGAVVDRQRVPRAPQRQRVDVGREAVVDAPRDRLVPDHRPAAADVVVVPTRVHRGHVVAARGVLFAFAAVAAALRVVAHDDQRAVARLARGGRRHAGDAPGASADVAHRPAHAAVLPHHLDRAVVVRVRGDAPRRLHVELLRDAVDVLAVGSELALVAQLRPDVLALAQRLVVGGQHEQYRPRRGQRESRALAAGLLRLACRRPVVAQEPRHRFGGARRRIALGGHAPLRFVRSAEQLPRGGDALAQRAIVDSLLRHPVHDHVAAVDRDLWVAVVAHVRVELGLQLRRGDHVGRHEPAALLDDGLLRLAARLGAALLVVLERRQFLHGALDFDRRVVFQEVDDVIVAVERALLVLGVDRRARIPGHAQHQRLARRDVGQGGRRRRIGVVPAAGLGDATGVGVLHGEGEGQLRVVAAHHVGAEVELQRAQGEQHRQRILAAAVDAGPEQRVAVDPGQEVARQLDALRLALGEGARARRVHVGAHPRLRRDGRLGVARRDHGRERGEAADDGEGPEQDQGALRGAQAAAPPPCEGRRTAERLYAHPRRSGKTRLSAPATASAPDPASTCAPACAAAPDRRRNRCGCAPPRGC